MITISNLSLEDRKKELILLLERYPTNFVASHSKLWPFLRRSEWSEIGLYLTLENPSLALSVGNDIVALTEAKILAPELSKGGGWTRGGRATSERMYTFFRDLLGIDTSDCRLGLW